MNKFEALCEVLRRTKATRHGVLYSTNGESQEVAQKDTPVMSDKPVNQSPVFTRSVILFRA